jgi:hypothetical protein
MSKQLKYNRRHFLGAAAMTLAASEAMLSGFPLTAFVTKQFI